MKKRMMSIVVLWLILVFLVGCGVNGNNPDNGLHLEGIIGIRQRVGREINVQLYE